MKLKSQDSGVKSQKRCAGMGDFSLFNMLAANSYLLFVEVPLSTPADFQSAKEPPFEGKRALLSVKSHAFKSQELKDREFAFNIF